MSHPYGSVSLRSLRFSSRWIGKGILLLRGKKEWQNLGNKGNRVSHNTLLACFFLRIIFISCCIWVGRSEVQIYVGYDTVRPWCIVHRGLSNESILLHHQAMKLYLISHKCRYFLNCRTLASAVFDLVYLSLSSTLTHFWWLKVDCIS